jgi:hypothetical protein
MRLQHLVIELNSTHWSQSTSDSDGTSIHVVLQY